MYIASCIPAHIAAITSATANANAAKRSSKNVFLGNNSTECVGNVGQVVKPNDFSYILVITKYFNFPAIKLLSEPPSSVALFDPVELKPSLFQFITVESKSLAKSQYIFLDSATIPTAALTKYVEDALENSQFLSFWNAAEQEVVDMYLSWIKNKCAGEVYLKASDLQYTVTHNWRLEIAKKEHLKEMAIKK